MILPGLNEWLICHATNRANSTRRSNAVEAEAEAEVPVPWGNLPTEKALIFSTVTPEHCATVTTISSPYMPLLILLCLINAAAFNLTNFTAFTLLQLRSVAVTIKSHPRLDRRLRKHRCCEDYCSTGWLMASNVHKKRPSLATLKRDLNLHVFFRQDPNAFSSSTSATGAVSAGHLRPAVSTGPRRESFLYRPTTDDREFTCHSASRASSITSATHDQ